MVQVHVSIGPLMVLLVACCTIFTLISASSSELSDLDHNDLDNFRTRKDPCLKKRCSSGKECVIIGETAKCQCIKDCSDNMDLRRRVCSNTNMTWQSDCHLFRHKCLCKEGLNTDCSEDMKTMKINYYGECQEIGECSPDILIDFPRRIREWLYQVMKMRMDRPYDHDQLGSHEIVNKWVDAVIWKFCDLDLKPHDRTVSADELFPLRAPFLSMEPCIGTFLNDMCDPNKDQQITMHEWGQCLQVRPEEMEDKCNEFVQLSISPKAVVIADV